MRRGRESGQASAEYVGLIALLALAFAAMSALSAPAALEALALTVCDATGFCDGRPGTIAPPTPAESYEAALALPLDEFLALAASPERDERLDWTEDGCSRVPDSPGAADFHDACVRHDFAYRNAALLGSSDATREAADARFRADMKASCPSGSGDVGEAIDRTTCRGLADVYWRGVRTAGGGHYGDR